MNREELKSIIRSELTQALDSDPGPAAPASVHRQAGVDLVTEEVVMRARATGSPVVRAPGALVTPLARETAERYGIAIEEGASVPDGPAPRIAEPAVDAAPAPGKGAAPSMDVVAIASDHAGFPLKQSLVGFLSEEAGMQVLDLGPASADPVDYPDFAHAVAGAVARGEARCGIVVDGVGVGSAMAANRHPGVRAAALSGIIEVVNAREHNDANVLCLGGRMIGDLLARALTVTFLNTPFAGGRHARRVDKIETA